MYPAQRTRRRLVSRLINIFLERLCQNRLAAPLHKLDYSTVENPSKRPTIAMIVGFISGPIGYLLGCLCTANTYDERFEIICFCIPICFVLIVAEIFAIIARRSPHLTAKQKMRANIGIVAPVLWLLLVALLLIIGPLGA